MTKRERIYHTIKWIRKNKSKYRAEYDGSFADFLLWGEIRLKITKK